MDRFVRGLYIMLLIGLAAAGLTHACPIPVFQYALEHWPADPYVVTVRHSGEFTPSERAALKMLRQAAQGEPTAINMKLVVEQAEAQEGHGAARIELQYPKISRIRAIVRSDALTVANVRALLRSPIRDQLGKLLADRATAVWILLESGNRSADRETETLLTRELKRLEAEIMIPEAADWGGETVEIDSNVNFKILRLSRDNPEEQILVSMLLASEPDLATGFEGLPMVFPIYGRGLILYALVGRGITRWTLNEAARFLTGPCSCQIKAANPGTDLLLAFDWDARVTPLTPATVGETVGAGSFLRRMDDAAVED